MEKIKVSEVLVVEGRYDLNTLKQIFDATIVTTDGFGVFNDGEKLALIRRLAQKHGMPTPANDFFYEKIREIEANYNK